MFILIVKRNTKIHYRKQGPTQGEGGGAAALQPPQIEI